MLTAGEMKVSPQSSPLDPTCGLLTHGMKDTSVPGRGRFQVSDASSREGLHRGWCTLVSTPHKN